MKQSSLRLHMNERRLTITSVKEVIVVVSWKHRGGDFLPQLWVVKQGDAGEEALQRHLVEDKSPNGGASYADFLYHLHVNSVRLLQ